MGEPVPIMELAEQMIRLSGLEPERDIAIDVVGRRPGEKLHEELFNPYEVPQPTPAEKILRAEHDALDPDWVEAPFAELNLLALEGDGAGAGTTAPRPRPGGASSPRSVHPATPGWPHRLRPDGPARAFALGWPGED